MGIDDANYLHFEAEIDGCAAARSAGPRPLPFVSTVR